MTTFRAQFDGRVLIPEHPVSLPTGCMLEVQIAGVASAATAATAAPPLLKLAELASRFPENPDSPGDAASQHDHYLYGTPKRP